MITNKEKMVNEMSLKSSNHFKIKTYLLANKRYLLLYDKPIVKDEINQFLNFMEENFNSKGKHKTIIVVAETKDEFTKKELVYYNNVDTLIVLYLVDRKSNVIYMDDSWTFMLGLNYRKYVRKINKIIAE